jgi:hypothetical protein
MAPTEAKAQRPDRFLPIRFYHVYLASEDERDDGAQFARHK